MVSYSNIDTMENITNRHRNLVLYSGLKFARKMNLINFYFDIAY